MSQNEPRVVIVTFDASSKNFSLNPDPIRLPDGTTDLYFALQTANRGDADKAVFSSLFADWDWATASPVDGSGELWKVRIVNEPALSSSETYTYTVEILYAGSTLAHDPTVILDPPNTDPPPA